LKIKDTYLEQNLETKYLKEIGRKKISTALLERRYLQNWSL